MKRILIFLVVFLPNFVIAQQPAHVQEFLLPAEIEYYNNQVSGLFIAHNKLYLLAESRLQDSAAPRIFAIALADLDKKTADTSYALRYQILPIEGLEKIRAGMDAAGDKFEGLECMHIDGDEIYLAIETATPSPNCALVKGKIVADKILLEDNWVQIKKPRKANGGAIFNAGFEAMTKWKNHLYIFYEYNYFTQGSFVYRYDLKNAKIDSVAIEKVQFRITDITQQKGKKFTAINYFFKGDTMENGYVIDSTDNDYSKQFVNGKFVSYARLVSIKIGKKKISYDPFLELPQAYHGYNWEGIAKYKNGYFIVNDKYTPARPYKTLLIYVAPPK